MYTTKQQRKYVSRQIDICNVSQRAKKINKNEVSSLNESQNGRIKDLHCMQFMLTRLGVNLAVDKILSGEKSLFDYNEHEQYLILDRAIERGLDVSRIPDIVKFTQRNLDYQAEDNSDIDHPETTDAEEIPYVTPEQALQLKRGPGFSACKTILPYFVNGIYQRDSQGNIDFNSIYSYTNLYKYPVEPNSFVDLAEGSPSPEYGILLNGNAVHIPKASRAQHFSIANRIAKKHGQISGNGGNSPNNLTWHHLIDKYKMVLVDRVVHRSFGHNGGFYFW